MAGHAGTGNDAGLVDAALASEQLEGGGGSERINERRRDDAQVYEGPSRYTHAWVVDVAQAAADAAKEGGFMGFKAQLVSEGELSMLDRIREAVGD